MTVEEARSIRNQVISDRSSIYLAVQNMPRIMKYIEAVVKNGKSEFTFPTWMFDEHMINEVQVRYICEVLENLGYYVSYDYIFSGSPYITVRLYPTTWTKIKNRFKRLTFLSNLK